MAVDGSIHINTKIDAKGINQGTKQIAKATKDASKPLQGFTKSLNGILSIVKGIGAAMVAAFVGGSIINAIRGIVQQFDLLTGSSGDKFKALSGALETLKGAFVNLIVQAFVPMIPYLIEFVHWLTTVFQTVTQIIAALFGFESTVGGIMTKAASGAKKAAKEAKGALAAFDQINVLQQKQEPETPEGATATPGPIAISDELIKQAEAFLEVLKRLFTDPLFALHVLEEAWKDFVAWVRENLPFGEVIADILTIIGDTLKKMFFNFVETFLKIKENILRVFQGIKDFLTGVFTGDWVLAWQGLVDIVGGLFGILFALIEGILNHIMLSLGGMVQILQVLFAPVIEFLAEMFERIKVKIADAIASIMGAFGNLAKWFFENVWNPIEAGFGSALTGIKQGFEKTFNGIKTLVKGIINTIIDYINGMIEGIVFGINTVIGSANAVAGLVGLPEIQSVQAPQIPRLATGAVIPPNSQFLAVLGDQRSGRNIEAPESLIRQIVREETGNMQAEISIRFEGTLAQLVRELKPHIDRENVRIGNSLAKGVVKI